MENRLQNRWEMSVYVPMMLNFDMVSRYIQGELYEQIKLHKPIEKPPIPGIAGVLMRRDFSILETPGPKVNFVGAEEFGAEPQFPTNDRHNENGNADV